MRRTCGRGIGTVRSFFSSPSRRTVALRQTLAHPREAVYSVVADVGSYSQFLPFCKMSRIVKRHGAAEFEAELSLGFLAFSDEYVSRVRLMPPSAIVASASHTPLFEQLITSWRFFDGAVPGTCDAHFELIMQLRSIVYDQALARVIDRVAADQMAAFKRRCDELTARKKLVQELPTSAKTAETSSPVCTRASLTATPRTASAAAAVVMEPLWRQHVDIAFDAHAVDGALSLGRFVEACRHLGIAQDGAQGVEFRSSQVKSSQVKSSQGVEFRSPSTAARDDPVSEVLLAAWFVEFDDDANGTIEREEFSHNLWLLTKASDEERMDHMFRKLDHNGSGAVERDDLALSMRRQLALARRLLPLLVRRQVRKETAAAALGSDDAAARAVTLAVRECQAEGVCDQASAVAAAAIDELDGQVDLLVGEVFASFGSTEAISFAAWQDTWRRSAASSGDQGGVMPTSMMGMDGILGLLRDELRHDTRPSAAAARRAAPVAPGSHAGSRHRLRGITHGA